MDDSKKVQIYSSADQEEIKKVVDFLGENGIASKIKIAGPGSRGPSFGGRSPVAGGVQLWVAEKDEEKAFELIKEMLPEYFTAGEEEEEFAYGHYEDDMDNGNDEDGPVKKDIASIPRVSGILFSAAGAVTLTVGFILKMPLLGIIAIVVAGIAFVLNGYVGFKTQRIFSTLLCIVSLGLLIAGIVLVNSESIKSLEAKAMKLYSNKQYDEALVVYKKALKRAEFEKKHPERIFILSYMANIYHEQSFHEKAYAFYSRAVKIGKETKNTTFEQLLQVEMDRIKKIIQNQ